MKTLGILQTGRIGGALGARHGEYPDMFREMLGLDAFEYHIYPVIDGVLPKSVDECDGWIITGSRHGVYEDHPWIAPLEAFIRAIVAADRPTAGICFGHQIMAQALGGSVVKFDGGWGIGPHLYRDVETGEDARLFAFHQDQVISAPPGATITHISDFCAIAGLRYSPRCFSLQPHPEHKAEFVHDLIQQRRGASVPDALALQALPLLSHPNEQQLYGRKIRLALGGADSAVPVKAV